MGSTYDLYKGLRNLQASKIVRRLLPTASQVLVDSDKVKDVLADGEEVLFELESQDVWIKVVFHMYNLDELLTYSFTEVRVEKSESLIDLKKKLQRVAYEIWFKWLDGTD